MLTEVSVTAVEELGVLFARSPVPMWVIDAESLRFVAVNEAAERQYGYSAAELVGQPAGVLRLAADAALLAEAVRRSGEDGLVRHGHARHRRRDGSVLEVDVTTQDIVFGGRPARIVMALDLTERNRTARRLERLHAVTARLAEALTPGEVAEAVVDEGARALGAQSGSLALVDASGAQLDVVRAVGYPEALLQHWSRIPLSAAFPLADVVREGEPLFLCSAEERAARYPALVDLRSANGSGPMAAAPLLLDGTAIGSIGLNFPPGTELGADERAYVLALAQQCAQALHRARLYDEERRSRRVSERLQALTEALSSAATEAEVGDATLREGVAALGAYAGVLALEVPGEAQLELLSSVGYPAEACMSVGRRWPADASIPIAEAARTGNPVFLESHKAWAEHYGTGGYRRPSTSASAAWAALPLALKDGARGALLWTYAEPTRLGPDERALLQSVARVCAQGLDRARLFEAERRARAEAERLAVHLDRAWQQAEEANLAKSQFLATMSHELRTPLNAIGGYAELMEMELFGPVTGEQRTHLLRIKRSQEHLLGLINSILNFARLEAGRVEYELEDVPLAEALERVAELILPQAQARGVAVHPVVCAPELRVRADLEKLRQVVLNLLSNAVKFTPAGGSVSVTAGAEGAAVAVRVRDTGIGIAEDQLAKVFDPFVQVGRVLTSRDEGLGLGLAISRDLARGMGGDLAAESVPGQGSTFTLTLPRVPE